jgi:hypothetical protein
MLEPKIVAASVQRCTRSAQPLDRSTARPRVRLRRRRASEER